MALQHLTVSGLFEIKTSKAPAGLVMTSEVSCMFCAKPVRSQKAATPPSAAT
jgi:hypothetical protein